MLERMPVMSTKASSTAENAELQIGEGVGGQETQPQITMPTVRHHKNIIWNVLVDVAMMIRISSVYSDVHSFLPAGSAV